MSIKQLKQSHPDELDIYAEDWASESDRVFFQKNPEHSARVRRAFPNEILAVQSDWVLVYQLHPGARVRMSISKGRAQHLADAANAGVNL